MFNFGKTIEERENDTPLLASMSDTILADREDILREYTENLVRYEELETWVDGTALDEYVSDGKSTNIDLYPVKINPLINTISKHASVLFGETNKQGGMLVKTKYYTSSKDEEKAAKIAEDFVTYVWNKSHSKTLMLDNAVNSQIYGGCVFKVNYDPINNDPYSKDSIRVEAINPKYFVGIPSANDLWRLNEAWVIRYITHEDARRYGVFISDSKELPLLIEHWTKDTYSITINGEDAGVYGEDMEFIKYSGENPYGIVPFVYIPHFRTGLYFYGLSLIKNVKGIIKEMNLRMADYGDLVSDESHQLIVGSNINKNLNPIEVAGRKILMLGSNIGITDKTNEPKMYAVDSGGASSKMASDLYNSLYAQYRRDVYHPAVADGEDEGSQRSSETLNARMWSLVNHINTERIYWTEGLNIISDIILKIGYVKGIEGGIITEDMLSLMPKQSWNEVLPRDREKIVSEAIQRIAVGLGSPELLLSKLGDAENIDDEIKLIKDWFEFLSQNKINNQNQNQNQNEIIQSSKNKKENN